VIGQLSDGVKAARASVGEFLEAWGHARTVRVDPEQTFRDWVTQRKLPVPRNQDEVLVEALLGAWNQEPGNSLADCVNAVTRVAHSQPWPVDFSEELERRAAQLVPVRRQPAL
jgi:hypothetical protein